MRVDRSTIAKILATVFVVNLVVMGAGAWHTYQAAPPVPQTITGPDGETVVTNDQIQTGKEVFQANGLMDQGSILGHGAYFDTDYTADALALKAEYMREYYAQERTGTPYADLDAEAKTAIDATVKEELQSSTSGQHVEYSAAELYAHEQVRQDYVERYHEGDREAGIPAGTVETSDEAERFADFALWTAWMAHTERPGGDTTFTNNWPYVPAAGNGVGSGAFLWSVVGLFMLVTGVGAIIWLYYFVELPKPKTTDFDIPRPGDVRLVPSQLAAARYVLLGSALFLLQTLLGGVLAHYYIERGGFYGLGELLGVDVLSLFPFAIVKTWHIDAAILWVASLWLGAGLFVAPLLTGREPKHQKTLVNVLFGALAVVGVGGLAGIWLGTQGYIGDGLWWLLGNEGLEYLELGRVWQVGVLVGLLLWTVLMFRALRPLLEKEPRYGLGHLLLYASGSIGFLFMAGLVYTPETNLVVTEFWRWWVVHMWVEGVFEFFIVATVAVVLVSMRLLSKRSAEKAVLLETVLVMGTGVIGVAHHYWWVALPEYWIPLSSIWSTLELVPLGIILFEAFNEYRSMQAAGDTFAYRVPFLFIIASSVWNFVGAGILGTIINFPVVGYYEHGTYLTVAHGHAAFFGAFGMLALGMGTYVLRFTTDAARWSDTRLRRSFWAMNIGLALMLALSVIPVGVLQLEAVFSNGYAAARSLAFYNQELVQTLMWARMPGDVLVILGALLFTWDVVDKLLKQRELPARAPSESPSAVAVESDD
ncbi:nitric-oxide reductase large subunit [Halobacteriaceae archaeon GCM10025711]